MISQTVSIQFSIWSRYSSREVSIPQSLQATVALAQRPCSSARPPQKMHLSSGMDRSVEAFPVVKNRLDKKEPA